MVNIECQKDVEDLEALIFKKTGLVVQVKFIDQDFTWAKILVPSNPEKAVSDVKNGSSYIVFEECKFYAVQKQVFERHYVETETRTFSRNDVLTILEQIRSENSTTVKTDGRYDLDELIDKLCVEVLK